MTVQNSKETRYLSKDIIQLNHYWTRDEEFFYLKARKRNAFVVVEEDRNLENLNRMLSMLDQDNDCSVQCFVPALKDALEKNRKKTNGQ